MKIEKMQTLRLLFQNLDHFRGSFFLLFLVGLVDGIVTFFIPVCIARATEHELSQTNAIRLLLLLFVLYFSSHTLQWLLRNCGEALAPIFSLHMRQKYFRNLEETELFQLQKHHSGYLLTLISSVTDGLGAVMIEMFWGVSRSIANIGLFFYFTAEQSLFAAVVNLVLLCLFVMLSVQLSYRMIPLSKELNVARAQLLGSYADFAAQIFSIKKLGLYSFASQRLQELSEQSAQKISRLQRFHASRWFLLHSVFSISVILTLGVVFLRITHFEVRPSILILFVSAFTAVKMNAERLSEDYKMLLELNAYARSLSEALIPCDRHGVKEITSWAPVRFQEVVAEYPGNATRIEIPDFYLEKGEKVGILGASGEGKTTLLNLLANFLPVSNGTRMLGGIDYDEISPAVFQKLFAVVSQDAELFHLTLRENLSLGKAIPEEMLEALLSELELLDWVKSLAFGLETNVGERGVALSQGQKQRINLLRCFLLEREIFLFDEPTSQLDKGTELLVRDFIERRFQEKTCVIVTHRESLLPLCSRIYQFDSHLLVRKS